MVAIRNLKVTSYNIYWVCAFLFGFWTKTILRVLISLLVLTADKHKESKVIVDNIDELLRGLFKVMVTDRANAKAACLCLVNISSKENGLNKIMSFLNNSNITSKNDLVYYSSEKNLCL